MISYLRTVLFFIFVPKISLLGRGVFVFHAWSMLCMHGMDAR